MTVKNNINKKEKVYNGCKISIPLWKMEICHAAVSDIFTKITETFHVPGKNSIDLN